MFKYIFLENLKMFYSTVRYFLVFKYMRRVFFCIFKKFHLYVPTYTHIFYVLGIFIETLHPLISEILLF